MGYDMQKHYGYVATKVLAATTDQNTVDWIAQHPEANLSNYQKLVEVADELTPQHVWDDWDAQMSKTALHYGASSPVNIFSWLINSSLAMRTSEKWNPAGRSMFAEKLERKM